jgi:hypothetical protein
LSAILPPTPLGRKALLGTFRRGLRIVKDIKSLDTLTEIGNRLNISVSTVSVAVKKGWQIVGSEDLKLVDLLNVEM